MRTITKTLLATLAIALTAVAFIYHYNSSQVNKSKEDKEKIEKENNEPGIQGAIDYYIKQRRNQATGIIDPKDVYAARAEVMKSMAFKSSASGLGLNWSELGPDNIGGRSRAILIDKNNPNKIFAGGVSGGLFVSTNAGGLWSAVPGVDQLSNIAVSCIAQGPNGDIYFGTGEGLYPGNPGTGIGGGISGGGMFKSTDGGNSFSLLPSTQPNPNSNSGAWALINQVAVSPLDPNKVWAATNTGLKMSYDGGATWYPVLRNGNGTPNFVNATDVDVASDGTVIAAVGSSGYISTSGDTTSFTKVVTGTNGLPDPSTIGRIEFAIAPTDPNFIYASVATTTTQTTVAGKLNGVFQTTNKGISWKTLAKGPSSQFEPFVSGPSPQGIYDNAIAVSPFNKNFIVLGGVELFKWQGISSTDTSGAGQWTQLDGGYYADAYVHPDKHVIKFHPTDKNTVYIGCDGGIFRSSNIMTLNTSTTYPTFTSMDRGFDVTQFYGIAFSPNSTNSYPGVLGGAQDNGSLYNDGKGSTLKSFQAVDGGDGGECEVSSLSPSLFTTVYYGSLSRNGLSIYSKRITSLAGLGNIGFASFVTPIALYENLQSVASYDSVTFWADKDYNAGDKIGVLSKRGKPLDFYSEYVLPVSLNKNDTLRVPDLLQTRLVVGFAGGNGIWMTTNPLTGSKTPDWFKIGQVNDEVEVLTWSPDGDNLYVGTSGGLLYRISNMLAAVDSASGDTASAQRVIKQTRIGGFNSRFMTGIAVDPNNDNNILVTLGNYGNTNYVYLCTNAKTAPSSSGQSNFTAVQGTGAQSLPSMPVYSAVFVKGQPNTVLVGTEYGVWSNDSIMNQSNSLNWMQETNGQLPQVPCYALRQQVLNSWECQNSGTVYVGTHGRGIWKCENFFEKQNVSVQDRTKIPLGDVSLYPNPAVSNATVEFTLSKRSDLILNVYSLNGKLVRSDAMNSVGEGKQRVNIDCNNLAAGTYLLNIKGDVINSTKRFVVIK